MPGGDARKLLNILDLLEQSTGLGEEIVINDRIITERLQENPQAYDKTGRCTTISSRLLSRVSAVATLTPPYHWLAKG